MFTLAHLSDPHLAPLPEPRWRELIGKRVTGYINWQRRRRFIHDRAVLDKIVADVKAQIADHIAVTGDIANIALEEEFVRGRQWLQDLGSLRDVSFVPGNHDAYVRQGVRYAPQWAPYMSGDDDRAGFPYLRLRGSMALIGLSTAVPTAWGLATGRLGDTQCVRLSEILGTLAGKNVFRTVLIHHPPVSQAKWYKLLTDTAPFLHVIATRGAELVLHGHDHLHMINWLSGPAGARVPAVGVPSASAAPGTSRNAAAYNLYHIEGAPGAWRCELISRGIDASGAITEQKRVMLID